MLNKRGMAGRNREEKLINTKINTKTPKRVVMGHDEDLHFLEIYFLENFEFINRNYHFLDDHELEVELGRNFIMSNFNRSNFH